MEPLRSFEPEPGFIEGVSALADETGAVLIFDEISAGFRFNTGGAHLVFCSIAPDIAVFSKALGNGYPISAILGTSTIMQAAQKTFISSTNWTERIGPTAALAMIHKHKALDVGRHLVCLGQKVQTGWKELSENHGLPIQVGGMKPMGHFSFLHEKAQAMKTYFIQLMLEQGFLASNAFYAMYAHSEEHVAAYLHAAEVAFKEIAHAAQIDDIDHRLIGKPAETGFKRIA